MTSRAILPGVLCRENYLSLIWGQTGKQDEAVQPDQIVLHEHHPLLDTTTLLGVYRQHGWQSSWRAHARSLTATPANSDTVYEIGVEDLRVNDLDNAFDSF